MHQRTLSLLLLLLLTVPSFGQAKAVIEGPKTANTGDLVVIDASLSTGKAFKWILPQKIQTLACGDGMQLGFASGTPGVYSFTLIAADTESDTPIDYETHTVTVGKPGTDPDPDPDPEPNPPPEDIESVRRASKQYSDALNDDTTSKQLAAAIRMTANKIDEMCSQQTCPTLPEAKRLMVSQIENVLLFRTGASRNVDWENGWRIPVNSALKSADTSTVPKYVTAMRAAALGLEE